MSLAEPAVGAPTTIGRYVVLGLVGKGAMGEVYAAYDPQLNRRVAIKVLRSRPGAEGANARLRLRMMREAQAIAKVSHPNVIVVHDVGSLGSQVFVAMEFVEGQTLSDWLCDQARPWPEVLRIFLDAGRGLAAAHEKDLVHRDFKPDNVMIGADGQVRVMDFGLARSATASRTKVAAGLKTEPGSSDVDAEAITNSGTSTSTSAEHIGATEVVDPPPWPAPVAVDPSPDVMSLQLTQAGAVLGTPAYMSPEQFLGRDTDARTDQFSFCVALYEGLYGEGPFPGQTPSERKAGVLGGEIRESPSDSGVPLAIRKLILRGLRIDPRERWPSMKALLTALEDNRLFAGRRRLASGASAKLSGIWEAPVRGQPVASPAKAEMRRAFLATGKPYATAAFEGASRILDDYATRWSAMYVDICEATHVRGEQSPEILDLRMAALMDCLGGLRALARIFREANAEVVENAVTAAGAVGGLERCADLSLLRGGIRPPEDHQTRAAVEELRARLAEVRVLGQVGRYGEGLEAIGPLEEEIRRVGYGPLLAESLLVLGRLHVERREADAAARALEEAVWAAELARHEEVLVEAAAHLVFVVGDIQMRFDVAEVWCRHAETVLRRLGGHDMVWGWLLNNRGALRYRQGRIDEALEDTRQAVTAKERAGGAKSPDVAISLNNIAMWLAQRGEIDEAVSLIERAWRIVEEGLGAGHPLTGSILSNYAEILNLQGRFPEAHDAADRSLSILERETGPSLAALTFPLTALGIACLGAGLFERAVPHLERAAEIRDASETDFGYLGEVHFALARALHGAARDLAPDLARAWALAERARSEYARAPQGPLTTRELAKIDAWLALHGRPGASATAAHG